MPDHPHRLGAVFLSYAHEDMDAARRLAEAIRAVGVEVWFDQNELRGGDAWDVKIRTQIRTCALFVPVISPATQARHEGYFRREWKLAVERTHDMAVGVPFLVPLVIDGIVESVALVPEEFKHVHWTQLDRGVSPAQFAAQLKKRLEEKSRAMDRPPSVGHDAARLPAGKQATPGWTWGALTAVVIGVAVALLVGRKATPVESATNAPESKPATAIAPVVTDKSIAVLPFVNMSDDKDATAFFADGVHEDILTSLVRVRELRVVSRTSVMEYRGTVKKIPQIGRELHVAYVLEGSVRRAGNKVRVTGQLIKAATDEHVWAKSFDRDLTDVFAIQAELAQTIATELDATLSPREQKLLEERPTTNPAAYDLYLKARAINALGSSARREDIARRLVLAEGAVALDPKFAQAWSELAEAHAGMVSASLDTTPARLAKARAALDQARSLAPDSPVVLRAVGVYYLLADLDGAKAIEQFERILIVQPNDADCLMLLAVAQRLIGRWPEAIATMRALRRLEPGNSGYAQQLVLWLMAGRRYVEAGAELALFKGDEDEKQHLKAMIEFHATGSRAALHEFYTRLEARRPDSPLLIEEKIRRARARGDGAEYARLLEQQISSGSFDRDLAAVLELAWWTAKRRGDAAEAKRLLGDWPDTLRARLELEPDNTQWLRGMAWVAAILDHHEEALRYINHAADLMPYEKDSQRAPIIRSIRAAIYTDMGDKARAVDELAELLRYPSFRVNVHDMAEDSRFGSLHGEPRFEAMLRDPKNNAPLF